MRHGHGHRLRVRVNATYSVLLDAASAGRLVCKHIHGEEERALGSNVLCTPPGCKAYFWHGLRQFATYSSNRPVVHLVASGGQDLSSTLLPVQGSEFVLASKLYSTSYNNIKKMNKYLPLTSGFGKVLWLYQMGKASYEDVFASYKDHVREALNLLVNLRKGVFFPETIRFEMTLGASSFRDGVNLLRSFVTDFNEVKPAHLFTSSSVGKYILKRYEYALLGYHDALKKDDSVSDLDRLLRMMLFEQVINKGYLVGDLNSLPTPLRDQAGSRGFVSVQTISTLEDIAFPSHKACSSFLDKNFCLGAKGKLKNIKPSSFLSDSNLFEELKASATIESLTKRRLLLLRVLMAFVEGIPTSSMIKFHRDDGTIGWSNCLVDYCGPSFSALVERHNALIERKGSNISNVKKEKKINLVREQPKHLDKFLCKNESKAYYLQVFRDNFDKYSYPGCSKQGTLDLYVSNLKDLVKHLCLWLPMLTERVDRVCGRWDKWCLEGEGSMPEHFRPLLQERKWTMEMLLEFERLDRLRVRRY